MDSINNIPLELLFHVFSYLTLKSLIASYGVCRWWRQLIPSANVLPTRRALFQLYLEIIFSPCFHQTRPWTLAKLIPFDREEYVATLLSQHNYLPEAFRLWVLEWPARAVFGSVWPGLPSIDISDEVSEGVEKLWGSNRLCTAQVSEMIWVHQKTKDSSLEDSSLEHLPGLLVLSSYSRHTWLMLDERQGKRDKVYELASLPSVIWGEDGESYDIVHANWIEFQRALWARIERAAS